MDGRGKIYNGEGFPLAINITRPIIHRVTNHFFEHVYFRSDSNLCLLVPGYWYLRNVFIMEDRRDQRQIISRQRQMTYIFIFVILWSCDRRVTWTSREDDGCIRVR